MNVMWGALGMLALILTARYLIPAAFIARMRYVDKLNARLLL